MKIIAIPPPSHLAVPQVPPPQPVPTRMTVATSAGHFSYPMSAPLGLSHRYAQPSPLSERDLLLAATIRALVMITLKRRRSLLEPYEVWADYERGVKLACEVIASMNSTNAAEKLFLLVLLLMRLQQKATYEIQTA